VVSIGEKKKSTIVLFIVRKGERRGVNKKKSKNTKIGANKRVVNLGKGRRDIKNREGKGGKMCHSTLKEEFG